MTPRQKAIICGSYAANLSNYDANNYSEHYQLWRDSELPMDWDDDPFCEMLRNKYPNGVPLEYVEKMSSLALATWHMESQDSILDCDIDYASERDIAIANILYQKWGILFVANSYSHQGLETKTEDDHINFWLLVKDHIILANPEKVTNLEVGYKRNGKQIYLSGGMEKSQDGGSQWRAKVTPALFRAGYDIYNPVYKEGIAFDRWGVNIPQLKADNYNEFIKLGKYFVKKDFAAVINSDIVLAYWDQSIIDGSGGKVECSWAGQYGIPLYIVLAEGFKREDIPLWTCGGLQSSEHIFNSFEEAIREIIK